MEEPENENAKAIQLRLPDSSRRQREGTVT
jgi:hypothetical protein